MCYVLPVKKIKSLLLGCLVLAAALTLRANPVCLTNVCITPNAIYGCTIENPQNNHVESDGNGGWCGTDLASGIVTVCISGQSCDSQIYAPVALLSWACDPACDPAIYHHAYILCPPGCSGVCVRISQDPNSACNLIINYINFTLCPGGGSGGE